MSDNPQLDACLADLGPLNTEVNRLCSLHDARLVLSALLSNAVSIGEVLSKHGKSEFVIEAFIGAAGQATRPTAQAEQTKLVIVGENVSEKRQ